MTARFLRFGLAMRNEVRRLRALFAIALATVGCDGDSEGTTINNDCSQACACYKPPPPEVVRKPYEPRCAETGGDAASMSDADASDAADVGDAAEVAACEEYLDCGGICGQSSMGFGSAQCRLVTGETGKTEVECTYMSPPCGRATEGQAHVAAPHDLVSWLSAAASLEAASVAAFERLERELITYDAPRVLIREASRAARDEVRHARVMASLARRHGGVTERPKRASMRRRSFERFALENAIEGCVRETYGALLATYQARFASDRKLRASFARIAADETRHAALAHAIDRWATTKLSERARLRIARARREAVTALDRELSSDPTAAMRATLGLPDARAARAMLATCSERLQ